MKKMTFKIKELEKENNDIKDKSTKTNIALTNLERENIIFKAESDDITKQRDKLKNLCKTLQMKISESNIKMKKSSDEVENVN